MADNKPNRLKIGEFHIPALDSGDYQLELQQLFSFNKADGKRQFSGKINFSVQGDRFQLNPGLVHSVFPPSGNLGEYSTVLPHIILSRSTLPWERHSLTSTTDDDEKRKTPLAGFTAF